MKITDYSIIKESSEELPKELCSLISNSKDGYILESIEYSRFKISVVKSPFILADNHFDLAEANNDLVKINVKGVSGVSFTGGNYYIIYEKDGDDSYIIHGNSEQGYNIFKLI